MGLIILRMTSHEPMPMAWGSLRLPTPLAWIQGLPGAPPPDPWLHPNIDVGCADKVENEVNGLYVTLKNQHKTNTYFPSSLQVRASLKV
jgi:hypothetical protein